MKILVDTNIVLDVLLERKDFYEDSFVIFQLADLELIKGYLSAASITDIFYFVRKKWLNTEDVYQIMDGLIDLFSVATVAETTIANALSLRWKDFEDAVQCMAATEKGVDCIVTRNAIDYKTSDIPCMSPTDFIAYFNENASLEDQSN